MVALTEKLNLMVIRCTTCATTNSFIPIRTRCHKTPTKSMANEAQLGAITKFETIQTILCPLNQVVNIRFVQFLLTSLAFFQ